MEWLDEQTLDAIYDAAVAADLVDRDTRAVLLQSLDDETRLALPDLARPDRQFRSDLRLLNAASGGAPAPLRAWLEEASGLTLGRPQNATFAAALATPDRPSGPHSSEDGEPAGGADAEPAGGADAEPTGGASAAQPTPSITVAGVTIERRWLLVGLGAVVATGVIGAIIAGRAGPDTGGAGGAVGGAGGAAGAAGTGNGRPPTPSVPATPMRPALAPVPHPQSPLDPRVDPDAARLAMSVTPITRAQYATTLSLTAPGEGGARPIAGLDLTAARAFCDALSRAESRRPYYAGGNRSDDGYRLPTAEVWQAACRGGWGLDTSTGLAEWTDTRRADGAVRQVVLGGGDTCAAERLLPPIEGRADVGFRVMRPLGRGE